MPKAIGTAGGGSPGRRPGRRTARSVEHQAFLNGRPWRRCSRDFLEANPLCEDCLGLGVLEPSRHAHHKVRPDVAPDLAYDHGNLMALCIPCHATRTARGE